MEAANEAGRPAVNAVLDRAGSTAPRVAVWPLAGRASSAAEGLGSPGAQSGATATRFRAGMAALRKRLSLPWNTQRAAGTPTAAKPSSARHAK